MNVGVIPARLGSTRFPKKILEPIEGKPMIAYVVEQAQKSQLLDKVILAIDSEETRESLSSFDFEMVMTSNDHVSGTDRVVEVINTIDEAEIIINIQGDEPEIKASTIDSTIECLKKNNDCQVATPVCKISEIKCINDPNIVKVVCDNLGKALYFSRSAIPYNYKNDINSVKRHIGLYAYKSSFLEKFVSTPQSTLEKLEQLEQLRVLSMGAKIAVTEVSHSSGGIDTPEQYQDFVNRNKSLN